jgi:hypothetical protein
LPEGFEKWRALCCRLFQGELFVRNIFGGFKNQLERPEWFLKGFEKEPLVSIKY